MWASLPPVASEKSACCATLGYDPLHRHLALSQPAREAARERCPNTGGHAGGCDAGEGDLDGYAVWQAVVKGTKMIFAGLKNDKENMDAIAYLKGLGAGRAPQ